MVCVGGVIVGRKRGAENTAGAVAHLAQEGAILLAAVRSAVLWRQMGGTMWDFVFSRRQMLEAVDGWLP